jgi:Fur family ferric uptake transcriptional regulator
VTRRRPPPPPEPGATIRAVGLRRTAPRVLVLRRLQEATSPLSHAQLAAELAPHGFDRATIYRNLMALVEAGLVARIDLGDHVWRFEIRRDRAASRRQHPHFVCVDCGVVSCLPGRSVRMTARPRARPPVVGQVSEVLLKGVCRACA